MIVSRISITMDKGFETESFIKDVCYKHCQKLTSLPFHIKGQKLTVEVLESKVNKPCEECEKD
jgi:hypothetical protein